jgi:glycosyltransferase involved in cell wall biosynthesis
MACGKAIVSTPYLYAKALCSEGRGILVNFRDSQSISDALLLLLDNPQLRMEIERRAYAYGRQMTWQAVGKKYAELFAAVAQEFRRPWVFITSPIVRRPTTTPQITETVTSS